MSLQVYASDAEESVYSGPSRAGDYSSLDLPQPGLDTGAVYRNPRFCRTQGHRVGTYILKVSISFRSTQYPENVPFIALFLLKASTSTCTLYHSKDP